MSTKKQITYPFPPPSGYSFTYVPFSNQFMQSAYRAARDLSLDTTMPTGSVIVNPQAEIIGRGGNGSNYHKEHVCERVRLNIPTGQGYELCEGCHPKNHSEPKAIADTKSKAVDTNGCSLYHWGHWWCCQPCWSAMIAAGIKRVFLLENSQVFFNKSDPNNIVGRQIKYFSLRLK